MTKKEQTDKLIALQTKVKSTIDDYLNSSLSQFEGVDISSGVTLKSVKLIKESLQKKKIALFDELTKNKSSENFEKYIKHNIVIADFARGILTITPDTPKICSFGSDNESQIKIRDARFQMQITSGKIIKPSQINANWQNLITNHAKAAINLTEISDLPKAEKEALKNKIFSNLVKFMKETEGVTINPEAQLDNISQSFNSQIIGDLSRAKITIDRKQLSKKEIEQALPLSRDYSNLQDSKHEHLITISRNLKDKVGDSAYNINAAIRLHPLSPEIRQDYENIKKQTNQPPWYKELGVLEKKLILQNIDSILDGKTISSQLKHLPGLKNAYVEIRGNTKQIQGKVTLKDTYAEFRTGAIAQYGNKSDPAKLTKRNVEYLSHLAGGPVKLNVLNSNNPLGFLGFGEGPICNLTENAAKESQDVSYNNIPLSGQLTTPRLLLGAALSTATLPFTLLGGLGYAAWKGESKQITNFISEPIKFVVQARKDRRLDSLSSLSQEAAKSQTDSPDSFYMCYMCKSGKDRTGMQTLINNVKNTFTTLGLESSKQKKAVAAAIIDTGHSEAISSSHGATIGITQLKSNNVFAGLSDHFIGAFKGKLGEGALAKQNHLQTLMESKKTQFLEVHAEDLCKASLPRIQPHYRFKPKKTPQQTHVKSDRTRLL